MAAGAATGHNVPEAMLAPRLGGMPDLGGAALHRLRDGLVPLLAGDAHALEAHGEEVGMEVSDIGEERWGPAHGI